MKEETKMDERVARIKRAMENAKGDDLDRMVRVFKYLADADMRTEYGNSGKTRYEILERHRQDRAEWQAAWDLLVNVLPEVGY